MFEEMSDNMCLPYCSAEMKIKERMVYLFYELHRKTHQVTKSPSELVVEPCSGSDKSSHEDYYRLSMELGDLLIFIKKNIQDTPTKRIQYYEYLLYLFKMIVQTRDIYEGKGERDVTYMLIYTWYKHYPVLTVNVLPFIIQYGCWRDICGICNYIYDLSGQGSLNPTTNFIGDRRSPEKFGDDSHPLIETCVEIMIEQLEKDENCAGTGTGISLAAKWVPREKRQNQWLYDLFVLKWSDKKWPYILNTSKYSCNAYYSAWNKCRMKFRKMISYLTKKIDIIETKQCSGKWATIHPCHVNIGTIIKQKECLLNIKNNKERTLENCDRLQGSQNMQKLYKNGFPKSHRNNNNTNKSLLSIPDDSANATSSSRNERKSTTTSPIFIPINYFVKRAIELLELREKYEKDKIKNIYGNDSSGSHSESKYIEKEIDLLNIQWKKYISTYVNLPNVIPIIDISSNYSDKELYNAIGLACLISEKSLITKRVMITQNENMWVNLENSIDFISMVQAIYNNYKLDDRYNLTNSMNKIIESIQHSNMTNENIQEMIFVIFQSNTSNHNNICKMFNSYQPHFVYWNLSESVSEVIEYPCDIFTRGTTMISGNSPALINYLQFLGLASFRHSTPYNAVCNILDNNRYDSIEKLFMKTIE
jgi:hypothetical protein